MMCEAVSAPPAMAGKGRLLCKTEVGDDHSPVACDEDVAWLQIAVNDPTCMGGFESLGHLDRDRPSFVKPERTARPHDVRKRFSAQQFHRVKRARNRVGAEIENPAHVAVGDMPRKNNFTLKAPERIPVYFAANGLESDGHAQDGVFGFIDLTHPAVSQQRDDPVAVREDLTRMKHAGSARGTSIGIGAGGRHRRLFLR